MGKAQSALVVKMLRGVLDAVGEKKKNEIKPVETYPQKNSVPWDAFSEDAVLTALLELPHRLERTSLKLHGDDTALAIPDHLNLKSFR